MRVRGKLCVVGTVVGMMAAVGASGVGVAHAAQVTLGVSPSSGLVDAQQVLVSVSGANVNPFGRIYLEECGNAYADGTPLPATVDEDQDCTTIDWIDSPFTSKLVTIKQVGIGNGNRSCVAVANRSCFLWGPTGRNENGLVPTTQVTLSFAHDPAGGNAMPAPTTTTLTATGSPIATGKVQHALVRVADASFAPAGAVTVTEGVNVVGSADMIDGVADVVISPSLAPGNHVLVAHYPGDGSFQASDSDPVTLGVVGPDNISIGDVSVVNGVGGHRSMSFPVVLSHPTTEELIVPYTFVAGTAQPNVDYTPIKKTTGYLKYTAGAKTTTKYITVKLLSDASTGGSKTFTVQLGTPTLGSFVLRRAVGTGTIYDPDSGGPTVSVGAVSIPEGDGGNANTAKFPVTLSVVPTQLTTVTVQISTTLTDTALKAKRGVGDYTSAFQLNLKFKPGMTAMLVASAKIWPDLNHESDKTFTVAIVNVVSSPGQTVSVGSHSSATGVILSDE